ncbi:MAG TPA: hypothetical protein VGL33_29605 [Streptosporangiaceae bacterium]|jgi:arabinofuranosyltransferase
MPCGQRSLIYQGVDNRILTTPLRAGVPEQVMVVGVYLGTAGMLAPEQVGIVDFWGLANPLSNAWLLADYADPAAPVQPPGNFAIKNDVTPAAVPAARHALSCGDLAEIQRSAREPLSFGRFWRNLTGAWHRTQVTVPPDPFEAERKFCG